MTLVRRRLRLCVVVWFCLQVAPVAAFAPPDCCAGHRPVAVASDCHTPAHPPLCPMRAKDGTPCPMHQASRPQDHAAGHGTNDVRQPTSDRCVLRGTCEGPPLFTLFSNPGILPDLAISFAQVEPRPAASHLDEQPLAPTRAPDPRPPRL